MTNELSRTCDYGGDDGNLPKLTDEEREALYALNDGHPLSSMEKRLIDAVDATVYWMGKYRDLENKYRDSMALVWENKCWGRVLHTFHSSDIAMSYLETKKGFQCSCHCHKDRINFFLCVEGSIVVRKWLSTNLKGPSSKRQLWPGGSMSVGCSIFHQFEVVESGKVVEVYWSGNGPVRLDDIVRLNVGGPVG